METTAEIWRFTGRRSRYVHPLEIRDFACSHKPGSTAIISTISRYHFATNYINFGVEKALLPNVSYTMLVETLTQRQQGYPFVTPNAIHRAKLVLSADFKVPI
jgi:hypothetical protein